MPGQTIFDFFFYLEAASLQSNFSSEAANHSTVLRHLEENSQRKSKHL
jgi:hypothetical protein